MNTSYITMAALANLKKCRLAQIHLHEDVKRKIWGFVQSLRPFFAE